MCIFRRTENEGRQKEKGEGWKWKKEQENALWCDTPQ